MNGTTRKDPKDVLWEYAVNEYYDVYFEEILSAILVKRWLRIDSVVRLLIAITTSGSAIAGWALWEDPTYKIIWVMISGTAALFGIAHSTLAVNNLLERQTTSNREFTVLRHELEDFLRGLLVVEEINVKEKDEEFTILKKKSSDHQAAKPNDILATSTLQNKAQDTLDEEVKEKNLIEDD